MSIALVEIRKEELPVLKKIISAFTNAKLRVIKNEDEEELMIKLMAEGLKSEIVSEEIIKREFRKHGVKY